MTRNYILGLICSVFTGFAVDAQIISNSNFNENSGCPPGLGNIALLDDWFDVVQSADYYDCSFTFSSIFPTGNEPSPCGGGFVGFASYGNAQASSEAIGQQLAEPLVAGQTYEITVSVKMTTGGSYDDVCGGLCFYGFPNQPPNVTGSHPSLMAGAMELGCTETITNTVWQSYTVEFVAPAGVNFFVVTPASVPNCGQNLFMDCLEVEPVNNNVLIEVCEGEDVLLDPQIGPATWYEIVDGNDVFLTTAPTTYTYTGGVNTQIGAVTAGETVIFDIVFIPLPTPDLGDDVTVCMGTEVVLNAGLGYDEILWNGVAGNQTFNVEQSGVYEVQVTANGCVGEDEVTVTFLPTPTASNLAVIDVSCAGACDGTIAFQGNANWNITLNGADASTANTDLCAGAYTLIVELDGCSSTTNLVIDEAEAPVIELDAQMTICAGETVQLTATSNWNGLTYIWDNGDQGETISVTPADGSTYCVSAENAFGCASETVCINIDYFPTPEPDLGDDVTVCLGTPVVLNAGPGFDEFLWNGVPGNQTFNVVQSGVYEVQVTANGCVGEDEVTVTFLPVPTASNLVVTDASCEGACDGSIVFQGNANWNITLNGADASTANTDLCAGVYTLVVELDGCSTTTNHVLNEAEAPVIELDAQMTICAGETVQLTATSDWGGLTYTWDNGDQGATISVTPADGSTYCVSAENAVGCASETVCIDINHYPALEIEALQDVVICPNTTLNFDASVISGQGNYGYQWTAGGVVVGSDNTATFSPTETTEVVLTVTDGCTPMGVTTSSIIEVVILPQPELVVTESEVCVPGAIGFTLTDPSLYASATWEVEGFGLTAGWETAQVFNDPGCYDVTVNLTTMEGCALTLFVEEAVCALPVPIADFGLFEGDQVYVETGSSTTLNQSQFATQYSWSIDGVPFSEEESPVIESWLLPGIYELCLVASNDLGCSDQVCASIEVLLPPAVYIPNAFTPDYDGINDAFIPVLSFVPLEYELMIFDRWGEVLFLSNDPSEYWLGNVSMGDYFVQTEVYLYRLTVRMPDTGNNALYEGTVTVLR